MGKKKEIVITESQLELLIAEESGYAKVMEPLAKYINGLLAEASLNFMRKFNSQKGPEASWEDYLAETFEDGEEILDWTFDKNFLQAMGIDFLDELNLFLLYTTDKAGAMNYDMSTEVKNGDEPGHPVPSVNVGISILLYLSDVGNPAGTIMHELTHVYSFCQMAYKKGYNYANNYMKNNYPQKAFELNTNYNDKTVGIDERNERLRNYWLSFLVYIFNIEELKANTSGLYQAIDSQIKKGEKLDIKDIYNKSGYARDLFQPMDTLLNIIQKNEANFVQYIMKKQEQSNGQYADVFPSTKGKSVSAYQRRLYNALSKLRNKFEKKLRRIIEYYYITKKNEINNTQ